MKLLGIWAALLLASSLSALSAVTRDDLSPELQQLLPEAEQITIQLKSGETYTGEVISKDDTQIVMKVSQNRISFNKTFPTAEVEKTLPIDIGAVLAAQLAKAELNPQRSLPEADYQRVLPLLNEFIEKFPEHPAAGDIRKNRDAFAEELEKVTRGMEKIEGSWLSPVQAAIWKFNKAQEQMTELETRFPGIQDSAYTATNPRAKQVYERLKLIQREAARALPRIMTDRLPAMLADAQFQEAAGEVTAFSHFILRRVLQAEAGAPMERNPTEQELAKTFAEMDYSYLIRLHERILEAYQKSVADKPAPADQGTETMAFVPAGFFIMGDAKADINSDAFPPHLVYLDDFLIDKYEVTNAEYRKFLEYVQQTGDSTMEHPDCPPLKDHTPEGWKHPDLAGDDQPVVGVDWFDAYAYAKWAKKRLPTEAEWEFAARGPSGRLYPWGDETPGKRFVNNPAGRQFTADEIDLAKPPPAPPPKKLFGSNEPPPPPPKTLLPERTWKVRAALPDEALTYNVKIGDKSSASPYGCLHMAGNAAEWVGDRYGRQYYRMSPYQNPAGPTEGPDYTFRGGAFMDVNEQITAMFRGTSAERGGMPANDNLRQGLARDGRPVTGFRCAKSLK